MAWKPGESGNASGSKGEAIIRRQLMLLSVQEDFKRLRAGLEKLLDRVAEGDVVALNFVADRVDGKPKQQTELTGADGAPVGVDLNPPVMPAITREEWMRIYGPQPIEHTPRAKLPAASGQHG
jgi:hypothetical protein